MFCWAALTFFAGSKLSPFACTVVRTFGPNEGFPSPINESTQGTNKSLIRFWLVVLS